MLFETGGRFDDRIVEMGHLAGFVSVEKEKLVLCIAEAGRSRETSGRQKPVPDRSVVSSLEI